MTDWFALAKSICLPTRLVCPCGWTGTIDEQDALGSEMGCCPVCGNEDLKGESEATNGEIQTH